MKKIISLFVVCLLVCSAMAQRAAVMEFKAGVGVSQADVDGISAIFITYFRPSGYTMVERTQIDRVIEEQGFQRSCLTESQMVRIGQILNVSKIVVGDVNVVMGQYNVDVRVLNVQSGTIAATEGATFSGTSYRGSMQSIAQKLAGKIAIGAGPTVNAQPSAPSSAAPKTRTKVESVYGYLHVFPNELGVFQDEPTNVIRNINSQGMHGYDEWRIPTNEELSLLRANGYLSSAQYMTKENASGMVLLVTTGKTVAEKEAIRAEQARQAELARQREARRQELLSQGLVDLGLPSGTLWKNANEGGDNARYTYDEAVSRFGNKLPTVQQLEELKNECEWTWIGNGYKVTGPNGESITLPAAGSRSRRDGNVYDVGTYGNYWSSTPRGSDYARFLRFHSSEVGNHYHSYRSEGYSVRLVQ
ncbi:MAG: hypothetical protein J6V13_04285 [Paludibacteraceae bacterium]|nr:hypothetical protein [Paludibacteraceae bacterium]